MRILVVENLIIIIHHRAIHLGALGIYTSTYLDPRIQALYAASVHVHGSTVIFLNSIPH